MASAPKTTRFAPEAQWATYARHITPSGGLVVGQGNRSGYLYRSVPLGPILDAPTPEAAVKAGEVLDRALREIAELDPTPTVKRRQVAKSSYRHVHILRLRRKGRYRLPAGVDPALHAQLLEAYGRQLETQSLLLLGVRLRPTARRSSWRDTARSVVHSLTTTSIDLSDYARDQDRVVPRMAALGLGEMTPADFRFADSWWTDGGPADPPYLVHGDHIHLFSGWETARAIARIGEDRCYEWDSLPGVHSMSFGAVVESNADYVEASSRSAQWAANLLAMDADAISIRAMVEPAAVTRAELRAMRGRFNADTGDRAAAGSMSRYEQDVLRRDLEEAEGHYSIGGAPPTLTNASVIVAFSGRDPEQGYSLDRIGSAAGVELLPMAGRVEAAWSEMMLCSPSRANPYPRDLPATAIAYSGLPSRSTVGDATGAQLGLTEKDRQSVLFDHMAPVDEDGKPITVVVGQTGSGKACHVDTVLVTPTGTTTFGDVLVGDTLVDSAGNPTTVTFVTPVTERSLFEISFADGQQVRADADHQWIVTRSGPRLADPESAAHQLRRKAILSGDMLDATVTDLVKTVRAMGLSLEWPNAAAVRASLSAVDVAASRSRYGLAAALAGLARRLDQRHSDPNGLLVYSTAEMTAVLAESASDVVFAVPVAGSEADDHVVTIPESERHGCAFPAEKLVGSGAGRRATLMSLLRQHGSPGTAHWQITGDDGTVAAAVSLARSLGVVACAAPSGRSAAIAVDVDGERTAGSIRVEKIEPAEPGPARCITVDSPDASYQLAQGVVSHNTQTGLWLMSQFVKTRTTRGEKTPVVFPDLKAGSDFSALAHSLGGTIYSLDTMLESDGAFDAIGFSPEPEVGATIATSILLAVNPWGTRDARAQIEAPLSEALAEGAKAGARCTMEALDMAVQMGIITEDQVEPVRRIARSNAQFRAVCGLDPEKARPLRAAEGLTYIRLGNAHLDLPEKSQMREATLNQRISMALVRAIVYGSLVALRGREGCLMLDEGWIFLEGSPEEVERAGRLARQWGTCMLILTQRVKEIASAEIANYVHRGLILAVEDTDEAIAACRLLKVEPTRERVRRITASAAFGEGVSTAPNWDSLRPLMRGRKVLRGSVGLFVDQHARQVPVEIILPKSFLDMTSTNRLDRLDTARRNAEKAGVASS
jgi:hypothetical protein